MVSDPPYVPPPKGVLKMTREKPVVLRKDSRLRALQVRHH